MKRLFVIISLLLGLCYANAGAACNNTTTEVQPRSNGCMPHSLRPTGERIINADITDVSYVVSMIAIGYVSSPGKAGMLGFNDFAQFGKFIQTNFKLVQSTKIPWTKILGWFKQSTYFEKLGLYDIRLIAELKKIGVKISEFDVIGILRNSEGKIIFLERGVTTAEAKALGRKGAAGYAHIVEEHLADFVRKGISETELSEFILKTIKDGKLLKEIPEKGRYVYESIHKKVNLKIEITIANNGFIVGANPI